jgi:hypothetical protein
MDSHLAKPDAFGLERLGAHGGKEVDEVVLSRTLDLPCLEGVPEEGEQGVLVVPPALTVFAVDDSRFVRVEP